MGRVSCCLRGRAVANGHLSSDSSPVHLSGLDAPVRLILDLCLARSVSLDGLPSEESTTRSPIDSVPSSTPVIGSLAPTRADLLPPRKRFRDSYSSEASIEEDTKVDSIETEEPVGEDGFHSSGTRGWHLRDFYHHMSKVRIDRIVGIETIQRRLEADQLIARGEKVG
ncbi:hypothetical protein Tco_0186536 [Tanacetum coccineum]